MLHSLGFAVPMRPAATRYCRGFGQRRNGTAAPAIPTSINTSHAAT